MFLRSRIKASLEIGWLLLAVLPALWVNFWGSQPFDFSKAALVRVLAGGLLALIIADGLLGHRRRKRWRLPFLALAPALLGALTLSVVLAPAPALSLWGSLQRGQGLLTFLAYLTGFYAVALYLRSLEQARRLVVAMVATGVPLAILGLAQALGWQPLPLVSDGRSAAFATLGRSNFLGAYVALLLPLTGAMVLWRRRKWTWALLFVALCALLVLTRARAAWLGAASGLGTMALLLWGGQLRRRTRRLAWGALGLLFLAGPAGVVLLGSLQNGAGARARILIWRGTMALLSERPLLGYGPDSLATVFPRAYPRELVFYLGRDFFVDRAHNWLLDWTVMAGLLGLLTYLALVTTCLLTGWRALEEARGPRRFLLAAAMAAVAGNLANNLLSFDVTATAVTSWLLLGLVVAQSADVAPEAGPLPAPVPRWRAVLALAVAVVIAAGLAVPNLRLLRGDAAAHRADVLANAGNEGEALKMARLAVEYWPLEPAYHLARSERAWALAQQRPGPSTLLQEAETALLEARRRRPQDYGIWLALADFYLAAGRRFEAETLPLALTAYEEAARRAPNHALLYLQWGDALLAEGWSGEAAPLLRRAVRMDASDARAVLRLGDAELALGRPEAAIPAYLEAVRLAPGWSAAYAGATEGVGRWRLTFGSCGSVPTHSLTGEGKC